MTTPMPLCHALRVLAETHTADDREVGYQVHGSAAMHFAPHGLGQYIEAWGVVRRAVGLPTEPSAQSTEQRKPDPEDDYADRAEWKNRV